MSKGSEQVLAWRKKNPERARAIWKKYQETHKEERLEYTRKWREENREHIRKVQKDYRNDTKGKRKVYEKKWQLENKDKVKAMSKRHREKLKRIVINHYSSGANKCLCCGEELFEFLTIDHINGNGTKHRKEVGKDFYRWLIHNKFPGGFRVLCMNCNHARGIYGECPHERIRICKH